MVDAHYAVTKKSQNGLLHVELEQDHVAVLDDVFPSFHSVQSFLTGGGNGTAPDQVVVGNGLGLDKAAFKIAVNRAGGSWRGVTRVNRPGADFLLAGGEKSAQAEQMIGAANQGAGTRFRQAQ